MSSGETGYPSRCGGSGRKFGHADADKEDTKTRNCPTPDHCDGAAVWKGVDEDGGHGGQKTYDAEDDPEDLEGGELSSELLLVAQAGEKGFICLTVLVLHSGSRENRGILCVASLLYLNTQSYRAVRNGISLTFL